jgi:glycosyltransferase involved in cell wall biosynthesis
LEYIIIDGASTDDSPKIIKKYQKHLKYWQSKKDHGQADALNIGFKYATGDILCWLNSDDILLPNSLHLVGKIFSDFPRINWLTSQSIIINDQDQIVRTGIQFGKSRLLLRLGFYHGKFMGFIPQEGTFWTKKLWQQAGKKIPQKNLTLDYQLWRHFAKYSPLTNLEAPLAAFRLQPNQKTNSHTEYYREINSILPCIPYLFRIFGRIFAPFSRYIFPRVYYHRQKQRWIYQS